MLIGLHPQGVILIDPPTGATLHPYAEFTEDWTGVAVAFPNTQAGKDQFLATLRWHKLWAVWPVRIVGAVVLGGLAWWLFRGANWPLQMGRMLTTSRGARP